MVLGGDQLGVGFVDNVDVGVVDGGVVHANVGQKLLNSNILRVFTVIGQRYLMFT